MSLTTLEIVLVTAMTLVELKNNGDVQNSPDFDKRTRYFYMYERGGASLTYVRGRDSPSESILMLPSKYRTSLGYRIIGTCMPRV